ncbi:hypothetical protein [Paenibacillus thermotolerans]|uniref:hypothetical protein n=1 Tax=Paenibacillus thermotolerans TaxID=3027807 RepID=UPI0023674D83|nr:MULTISPECIES: hypothetical protein [unclassified Paenibacillus]
MQPSKGAVRNVWLLSDVFPLRDRGYWTRLTVNSIVGRLPDEAETTARLLRNVLSPLKKIPPLRLTMACGGIAV